MIGPLTRVSARILPLLSGAFVSSDGQLRKSARILSRTKRNDMLFFHHVARWFRDDGDVKLRLNYPELREDSVIFDLGGYKGQFASDIFAKYGSEVYVFEPFQTFFQGLQERFRANYHIRVFGFGLAGRDETQRIYFHDDGTSVFRPSTNFQVIRIRRFSSFVQEHDIATIDLLKVNIEGSEYDLLDDIIGAGLQHRIRNIQVQFHRDIVHAYERMEDIKQTLRMSHNLTYEYPFVWENYRLKSS